MRPPLPLLLLPFSQSHCSSLSLFFAPRRKKGEVGPLGGTFVYWGLLLQGHEIGIVPGPLDALPIPTSLSLSDPAEQNVLSSSYFLPKYCTGWALKNRSVFASHLKTSILSFRLVTGLCYKLFGTHRDIFPRAFEFSSATFKSFSLYPARAAPLSDFCAYLSLLSFLLSLLSLLRRTWVLQVVDDLIIQTDHRTNDIEVEKIVNTGSRGQIVRLD